MNSRNVPSARPAPNAPRTKSEQTGLVGLTAHELGQLLEAIGVREGYRADQIYRWIHDQRATSFSQMTNLPKKVIGLLENACHIERLKLIHESRSADGTLKFLFGLADGRSIETVLIPSEMRDAEGNARRRTLCLSTQVGCPLDCKFCATASMKLKRNLTTAEIILQVIEAERSTGEEITNIVFMGMGEPMLNYQNVVRSIRILTDRPVQVVGSKRITVSTSGLPDEIRKFAHEGLNVKLALSLHATNDLLRSKLMPINRRYPIAEVLDAMDEFYRKTHIPVTYEYILFDGLNDSDRDAKQLAKIARRIPSRVNVIPFHPIDFTEPEGISATLRPTSPEVFDRFLCRLRDEGVNVRVRSSSGKDIEAACGQLALAHSNEAGSQSEIHSIEGFSA